MTSDELKPYDELDQTEQELWSLLVAECPPYLDGAAGIWLTRTVKNAARIKRCSDALRERFHKFETISAGDGVMAYLNPQGRGLHGLLESREMFEPTLNAYLDECALSDESRAKFMNAVGGSCKEILEQAREAEQAQRFS